MLNDIISKKNQRIKLDNDIQKLEHQTSAGISREISDIKSRGNSDGDSAETFGCVNLIIFPIGFLWMYIGYEAWYGTEDWNFIFIIITHLPVPILALFGWWYYTFNKDYNEAKKEVKTKYQNKKDIEEKIDNLKKTVPNLNQEIIKLEKDYHNQLVKHFRTNYDKNNNGEIDILENKNDFLKYLQSYQDKIIEVSEKMGDDYIHILVKINDKLNLKRETINKSLVEIMKINNGFSQSSNIEVYESFINDEIQYYNSLLANSLFMASSLVNNDRITFRTIYEKFDKLNIFNSHYENQTLNLLNSINHNLNKIIQEIKDLNFSVTSALQDLTYATQENTEKITQELKTLDSSVNFNTLIVGINAYQNYKINKNTKSLRS